MQKKRNNFYDIVRIIACGMVILMHSPMPSTKADGVFLNALTYFTMPCIGLFFMVSGALLLPVKSEYVTFIRRRFSKIAVPTLFWSLVYTAINAIHGQATDKTIHSIISIPFSAQGHGVLWFMYTMAGLYLIAPIISAWLEKANKQELQLVLGLWAVTLCYPLLEWLVGITEGTTGILYYFTGYAGYFLLGYYLKRYPESLSLKWVLPLAVSGVALLLALKMRNVPFDFYRMFGYLSLFIAAEVVVVWKVIYEFLNDKIFMGGGIVGLSNLTFGIYLIHILIMREWIWQTRLIQGIHNYIIQSLVIALLTFFLSLVISMILSRLPGGQWIIGYRRRDAIL